MVRSSAKSIEWSKRLDRFQISGMTLSQFCKQENVSPHSFYYWKKQLAVAKGRQQRSNLDHAVKPDNDSRDIRVRCTVHVGAIRIECHIESPQALNAILAWRSMLQRESTSTCVMSTCEGLTMVSWPSFKPSSHATFDLETTSCSLTSDAIESR